LNSALLVGISTLPEYRGQGVAKKTLIYTMNWLRENGYSLVTLTSLYPTIYDSYGFKHISYLKEYDIPIDNFPTIKYQDGIVVKKVDKNDYKDLVDIYISFQKQRHIYYIRDNNIFKQLHEEIIVEKGNIYIIYNGNEPIGYFLAILENKILHIREFAFTNRLAINTFFSFIHHHKGQVENILITTPKDEQFEETLQWNTNCSMSVKPHMLGRILDIKPFLEFLNPSGVSLNIIDDIFNENSVLLDGQNKSKEKKLNIKQITPALFNYYNVNLAKVYNIDIPITTIDKSAVPFLNQYI